MITFRLLLWLFYIAADVWTNYTIIEKNKARPNYLLLFIVRGAAFILYGAFVWNFQYQIWYLNIFIFCVTSFWLLFDIFLNLSRDLSPFHIGKTSGFIDRFGVKEPGVYWCAKVMALILLILSVINIYQP